MCLLLNLSPLCLKTRIAQWVYIYLLKLFKCSEEMLLFPNTPMNALKAAPWVFALGLQPSECRAAVGVVSEGWECLGHSTQLCVCHDVTCRKLWRHGMSQAVLFCLVIDWTCDKPALEKLNWCLKLCWGFQIKLFTEASLLSRFLSSGPSDTECELSYRAG